MAIVAPAASPTARPDVNRSSNGDHDLRQGKRYIYSYRTIPSRGLLLLRAESPGRPPGIRSSATCCSPALAGAALAAVLSFLVARSIVRPDPPGRRREPRARRRRDARRRCPRRVARELASLAQAFNEMAAAARDLARERAELPALGEPRAEDAADRDPRLRRGPRRRAPSRPTRPRGRSSSSRGGSSGSSATCSTSRG